MGHQEGAGGGPAGDVVCPGTDAVATNLPPPKGKPVKTPAQLEEGKDQVLHVRAVEWPVKLEPKDWAGRDWEMFLKELDKNGGVDTREILQRN